MERTRSLDLNAWASSPERKPLVLRGARQVGKSWLVREWSATRFERVAEANLERRPEIASCFETNDPVATIARLEALLGQRIAIDGSTLLFLDEIQAAPGVFAKLRWFAEEQPRLPLIAAGSLLDLALADAKYSVPVGRITYLHLEPLGFREFCRAMGDEPLADWLGSEVTADSIARGSAVPEPLHDKATRLFREWTLVGGMPAATETWRTTRSFLAAQSVHRDLLASLRDDFAKYAGGAHHRRLASVLASAPQQLGSKFVYRSVDAEERAEALRRAVDLLEMARVCHRARATPAQGVPLGAGASDRAFKLFHLDVGLASTSLGLGLTEFESAQDVTLVNRGGIAEQAVAQLLRLTFPGNAAPELWWWRREKQGAEAEVDLVTSHGTRVVPIEVKAGAAGTLRSLHQFVAERGLDLAVRVNSAPPVVQPVDVTLRDGKRVKYRLLSIPPYLVEELPRLLAGGTGQNG